MADGVLLLVYWGLEEARFPLSPHGLLQSFSCSSLLGLSISSTPKALAWGHGQQSKHQGRSPSCTGNPKQPACLVLSPAAGPGPVLPPSLTTLSTYTLTRAQESSGRAGSPRWASAKTCSEEPTAGGSGMSFQPGMPHIPQEHTASCI